MENENELTDQQRQQNTQDNLDAAQGIEDALSGGNSNERHEHESTEREQDDREQRREIVRMSPQDEAREAISNRFRRKDEVPFDGDLTNDENIYGEVARQPEAELTGDEPEPGVPTPPAAEKRMITRKVRGVDVTLSEDEWLDRASMVTAADSYLQEARDTLKAAEGIKAERRAGLNPQHPEGQTGAQNDDLNDDQSDALQHPGDDVEDLVDQIQFGDKKEAAKKLRDVITRTASTAANEGHLQRLMANDIQKSSAALAAFNQTHPDLANDEQSALLIENSVYKIFREELVKIGIDEAKLPKDPKTLADWHRFQRIHGSVGISDATTVLNEAKSRLDKWRGVSSAQPQAPRPKVPGRVDVNVDRTQRRAAIPIQPSRNVAPRVNVAPQSQVNPRSQAVMEMRKARGQPTS